MSSRLIIKNLPTYLTSDQLKEHILTAPTSSTKVNIATNLTDLNLVKSKDGTSRRFAFLGFSNHQVANAVKDYFDKTYIHTSRISVDFAKEVGDDELKQRKERFREIARAGKDGEKEREERVVQVQKEERGKKIKQEKKQQKEKGKETDGKGKEKEKGVSFDDFLSIMAPGNMRRKKEDEKIRELNEKDLLEASTLEKQIREKNEKKERKEERKRKREEKELELEKEKEKQEDANDEEETEEKESDKDQAVNDEGLTDLEYMYRRMRRHLGGEKPNESEDLEKDDSIKKKEKKKDKKFEQSEDENEDSEEESSDESEIESDSSESKAAKQRQSQIEARKAKQREEESKRKLKEEDAVMKSSRLFVRNLPFGCKEEELKEWFHDDGKGGEVTEVHIPVDRSTKQSKGLGFVKFSNPSHALSALRNKDGAIFQGRLLHILAAVHQSSEPTNEESSSNNRSEKKKETLKQERFNQRKEAAGSKKAEFEWSMLYMNQDSVATSIANRLGISKSEILNPSSEDSSKGETSAAVKLALAETHLIKETRDWLEREGLDLESISNSKKKINRSDTTILVKNFPFGTRKEELEELFSVHGEVERLEMSPSGTIALVEMINENEARKAFKNVAYKRFGGGILYLEKAPERNEAYGKRKREEEEFKKKDEEVKEPIKIDETKTKEAMEAEQAQAEAESVATLYIKNLNFSTTNERLNETFKGLTDFTFARVQTKPSANGNARLSMGYGFVGFKSFNSASAAMKVMNGKSLDGHALTISFAKRGQESNSKDSSSTSTSSNNSTATKILVKNLPFEATKQDVRALFQSHSNVKSVRAPRKLGGKSSGARGFAFVEFHSNKDAKIAMEALKFTHLLGRHLVLSFASDEAGIEMEMAKSKARLGLGADKGDGMGTDVRKRKKVRLGEQDIQEAVQKERELMEVDVDED